MDLEENVEFYAKMWHRDLYDNPPDAPTKRSLGEQQKARDEVAGTLRFLQLAYPEKEQGAPSEDHTNSYSVPPIDYSLGSPKVYFRRPAEHVYDSMKAFNFIPMWFFTNQGMNKEADSPDVIHDARLPYNDLFRARGTYFREMVRVK